MFYLSIYLYDRNFINVILSKKLLLKSLFFGGTIIPYGWYLQSILVIYILYYLVYKYFFKSRIIFMGIALIIYSFIAFYVTKEIIYFQSVFTFELGIFWAIYKEKIDKILQNKKYYFLFLIITFLFFSISLLIGNLNLFNSTIISVINKIMSTIFFVILVLLLEMKIKLKNKVTTYLGKLFFEIYIVQWGGITIWHSKKLYIENDYIYLCITIVTTIILAIIVHPIISFINKKIKKY